MQINLKTSDFRTLSAFTALVFALPLSLSGLTGLYNWMSPFVMLNSVFVLKSLVLLNFISLIILTVTLFKKRWFCRYMCPVGWGCDLISGYSRRKTKSYQKLPEIGKWLAIFSPFAALTGLPLLIILDPMAIFNGFFSAFSINITFAAALSLLGLPLLLGIHIFFPGIWCNKLCPLGGLQLIVYELREFIIRLFKQNKITKNSTDLLRRLILASGAGLLTGAFVPKLFNQNKAGYIRPPAAISPEMYNTLCTRCGSCIKACPSNILTHNTNTNDLLAWMTPEVVFEKGYCVETCNLCSRVCPSGAITLFSIEAKKEIFMGIAEINPDNCLLTQNMECDRCKTACKYDALNILPVKGTILMKPEIIKEKCVGCGACAVICPVLTIFVKPLPIIV